MGSVYNKILEFSRKYPGGLIFRVAKHAQVLDEFINPDEEVLYAFCAQKNEKFSEIFNTFAVAVTSKRILLGHKRLLWGSFLYSITPELYNDMKIYKGLIWGKVVIDTVKEEITLSNIPTKGLDDIETIITEYMMEAKQKYRNDRNEV